MHGNKFPMNFPMQASSFMNGGRNNIAILALGTISSEVKELSLSQLSDSSATMDGPQRCGFPGIKLKERSLEAQCQSNQ